METKMFMSVRETARVTGLGESYIRKALKEGKVPHVKTGVKVLVNVPLYMEELDMKCRASNA